MKKYTIEEIKEKAIPIAKRYGVGKLPLEFMQSNPEVEWRKIVSVRNEAAHGYKTMDLDLIRQIVETHVPAIKSYCEKILKEIDNERP